MAKLNNLLKGGYVSRYAQFESERLMCREYRQEDLKTLVESPSMLKPVTTSFNFKA